MDVISDRISLTVCGRLRLTGNLPPELQSERAVAAAETVQ